MLLPVLSRLDLHFKLISSHQLVSDDQLQVLDGALIMKASVTVDIHIYLVQTSTTYRFPHEAQPFHSARPRRSSRTFSRDSLRESLVSMTTTGFGFIFAHHLLWRLASTTVWLDQRTRTVVFFAAKPPSSWTLASPSLSSSVSSHLVYIWSIRLLHRCSYLRLACGLCILRMYVKRRATF